MTVIWNWLPLEILLSDADIFSTSTFPTGEHVDGIVVPLIVRVQVAAAILISV